MEQKVVKPYHLFKHQGSWHIINVEGMFADSIEESAAKLLEMITAEPGTQLDPLIEEQLKTLGLLAEAGGQTQKTKTEIEKEPFAVRNMNLFLTQSCNLNCVYCYGDGGGYGSGGSMEEKTAFQAVDWLLEQAGEIKKLHIGFFGGEPFLNYPLMKAVVEYAKIKARKLGKEINFYTTTNATLLDDEKIAFVKEHQIAAAVSFDGPKKIQDAQRPYANGEGSYDATVPKIKKLLAAVPQTPGHAVILGNTEPDSVKDALREIGFTEISIVPSSQSLFAGESGKPEARTRLILQQLEQECENWISLTRSRNSEALKLLKAKSGLFKGLTALLHNAKKRYACGAGFGFVGVSCAGDIYLCHRFVGQDEYKLGNVFQKGLNREEYQKSPAISSGVCSTCFAKYHCAGGCKHDNIGSGGSMEMPPEDMCRLKCRELELAAVIACRLDPADKTFLMEIGIVTPKPCPLDF